MSSKINSTRMQHTTCDITCSIKQTPSPQEDSVVVGIVILYSELLSLPRLELCSLKLSSIDKGLLLPRNVVFSHLHDNSFLKAYLKRTAREKRLPLFSFSYFFSLFGTIKSEFVKLLNCFPKEILMQISICE